MNSPNPTQKHRVKRGGKMLQTKRDFMCLPWNTCVKEKRQENLFYTSNQKILHSLQVFILGTRHGILYMKPTLYSSDRINGRKKKNQTRQVTRLPLPHILWKLSFLRLTIASNSAWFTRKALEAKALVDHSAMAYGLKIFLAHLQVDLSPLTEKHSYAMWSFEWPGITLLPQLGPLKFELNCTNCFRSHKTCFLAPI